MFFFLSFFFISLLLRDVQNIWAHRGNNNNENEKNKIKIEMCTDVLYGIHMLTNM